MLCSKSTRLYVNKDCYSCYLSALSDLPLIPFAFHCFIHCLFQYLIGLSSTFQFEGCYSSPLQMLFCISFHNYLMTSFKDSPHGDSADPNCKVYASNINKNIDELTLKRKFEEFGVVRSCLLKKKPNDVTYSFIEFEKPSQARAAIQNLNGKLIWERYLKVECGRGGKKGFRHYLTDQERDQKFGELRVYSSVRRSPKRSSSRKKSTERESRYQVKKSESRDRRRRHYSPEKMEKSSRVHGHHRSRDRSQSRSEGGYRRRRISSHSSDSYYRRSRSRDRRRSPIRREPRAKRSREQYERPRRYYEPYERSRSRQKTRKRSRDRSQNRRESREKRRKVSGDHNRSSYYNRDERDSRSPSFKRKRQKRGRQYSPHKPTRHYEPYKPDSRLKGLRQAGLDLSPRYPENNGNYENGSYRRRA